LLATTLQVASIHKVANSFQHLLSQCFWPWELLLGQYAPVTFFFNKGSLFSSKINK
jgi:hypothetical protein